MDFTFLYFFAATLHGEFFFQQEASLDREYRVSMAEELRNLPIQGDYVTPLP